MSTRFTRFGVVFVFLLVCGFAARGQQNTNNKNPGDTLKEFEIIKGPSMRMIKTDTGTLQIIAGGAVVNQGGTRFTADSIELNNDTRIMQSFGNVHINDGDTVQIYSQYLLYNGISRFSYLTDNVKLTGRKGTLLTNELDYSSESGIGNYYKGGKIINNENVITSQRGTYYADTRDVYFKDNVKMDGPKDHIRSDSLIYNMNDGNITFVAETFIKNKEAEIRTSEGRYDTNKGDAFFSSRTNVKDSSGIIYTANNMAMEGKTGNAQLEGNAVIVDSADGFNIISDQVFINRQNNSFLATKKPLLIIKRDSDSTYVAADTIFSGLSKNVDPELLKSARAAGGIDSTSGAPESVPGSDSLLTVVATGKVDSTADKKGATAVGRILVSRKNLSLISFSTTGVSEIKDIYSQPDSLLQAGLLFPESNSITGHIPKLRLYRPNKILSKPPAVTEKTVTADTRPAGAQHVEEPSPEATKDTADRESLVTGIEDTLKTVSGIENEEIAAVTQKNDSTSATNDSTRYFIAFRNVRIFNDSLQSVCDSLFISSADSVFRLYRNPILWSGHTQVTGDTMFLYTKNKQADQLYVFDRAFVVNRTTEGFFNQIEGKTLSSLFQDNKFDSIKVRGSQSESIYYLQDADSAYIGIDRSTGDVIHMIFDKGELVKIVYMNEVNSHMYPMGQMPEDQKYLKGFEWLDKRRPKNRAELFQ